MDIITRTINGKGLGREESNGRNVVDDVGSRWQWPSRGTGSGTVHAKQVTANVLWTVAGLSSACELPIGGCRGAGIRPSWPDAEPLGRIRLANVDDDFDFLANVISF